MMLSIFLKLSLLRNACRLHLPLEWVHSTLTCVLTRERKWRLLNKIVNLGGLFLLLGLGYSFVWISLQCLLALCLLGLILLTYWTYKLITLQIRNLRLSILLESIFTISKPTHSKWYHSSHLSHPIIWALSSAVLHKQYNFIGSYWFPTTMLLNCTVLFYNTTVEVFGFI